VLITGSANFSNNSTLVNDSNTLIIRGDTAVADIYATEFMRMFDHYWFRAHMHGKTKGSSAKKTTEDLVLCLSEDSSWSEPHYQPGTRQMIERLAFAGI
jgi:phosphatidylserine/phosphatidylglycerophosphate/cardiolipin synthase-like enzyme